MKTLGIVILALVDVITVKALMDASHAAHHGSSGMLIVAACLILVNLVAFFRFG